MLALLLSGDHRREVCWGHGSLDLRYWMTLSHGKAIDPVTLNISDHIVSNEGGICAWACDFFIYSVYII